jgi:hypothetical protein
MSTVGARSRALPCSRDLRPARLLRRSWSERYLGLAVGCKRLRRTLADLGSRWRSCPSRRRRLRGRLCPGRPLRLLGRSGCRCSRARLVCLGRLRAFVRHVRNPFAFKGLRRFGQLPMSDVLIRIALAVKQLRRLRRSRLRLRRAAIIRPDRCSRQAAGGDCVGPAAAQAEMYYNLKYIICKNTRLPCIKLFALRVVCLVTSRIPASLPSCCRSGASDEKEAKTRLELFGSGATGIDYSLCRAGRSQLCRGLPRPRPRSKLPCVPPSAPAGAQRPAPPLFAPGVAFSCPAPAHTRLSETTSSSVRSGDVFPVPMPWYGCRLAFCMGGARR